MSHSHDVSFTRLFYTRLISFTRFFSHMMSHLHVSFHIWCLICFLLHSSCLIHMSLLHMMSHSHVSFTHENSFARFFLHMMSRSHVSSTFVVSSYPHVSYTWCLILTFLLHVMSHSHVFSTYVSSHSHAHSHVSSPQDVSLTRFFYTSCLSRIFLHSHVSFRTSCLIRMFLLHMMSHSHVHAYTSCLIRTSILHTMSHSHVSSTYVSSNSHVSSTYVASHSHVYSYTSCLIHTFFYTWCLIHASLHTFVGLFYRSLLHVKETYKRDVSSTLLFSFYTRCLIRTSRLHPSHPHVSPYTLRLRRHHV